MSYWVSIDTFDNHVEAHFYATLLDSKGIPCQLADETMMTLFPIYNISLGGIKLQVLEEDVNQATEILTSQRPNTAIKANKALGPCLNCGSQKILWHQGFHFKLLRFFAAILYIHVPMPKGSTLRCQKCGHTFTHQG
jgi:hypothetical protein